MYDLPTRETIMKEQLSRGVAPVIAVILMVAVTVILASVVAVFVLDVGGGLSEDAQAGIDFEQDVNEETVTVEVLSIGNAAYIEVRGDVDEDDVPEWSDTLSESGDSVVLERDDELDDASTGQLNAVGVTPAGDENVVATFEWDFGD